MTAHPGVVRRLRVIRGLPARFAPEVFAHELVDWVRFAEPPDNDLLHAILRNDLQAAIALTGGDRSWWLIRETMVWLWNFAPPESWGSPERCAAWRAAGGTSR